jgi:ribosomal-protein-alanine N-acetyltransferase
MTAMPVLETERLRIRPLVMQDLDAVHDILSDAFPEPPMPSRADRLRWLEWTVLSYEQYASLHQPPYGERAIELKVNALLVGACGFVPSMGAFGQIPGLRDAPGDPVRGETTPEFGLFYALSSAYRRQGLAAEAAGALVRYAFDTLQLRRVIATTSFDNDGSMGVMRKLGMTLFRNPYPDPPYLQVVGALSRAMAVGAG